MPIDHKLLELLVCPQCKGEVLPVDAGQSLQCNRCKLKYPVRDGIPVMVVEEAADLRGGPKGPEGTSVRVPRATFRVVDGPDINMTFQLEQGTCRALGRASVDPNRTAVFSVDITLGIDEGTRSLILQYISKHFQQGRVTSLGQGERLGQFRRAPDIVLTDSSLTRLHAMFFSHESGVGILDLVSKNGTFVNGQEVESHMLRQGDRIELGETTIAFEG